MYNKYYERLNNTDKEDYNMIEKECEKILQHYGSYDALIFINDYIYDLSDTVNSNYFLVICELEEYYMSIYRKGLE